MAKKNGNKPFGSHANWNIPGGIRTLDGEPLHITYRRSDCDPARAKKRQAQNHENALRRLNNAKSKLSAC